MTNAIIMGAGGRDFHNFLVDHLYDSEIKIVAFTWAQIPGVNITHFPIELADGAHSYSDNIPIFPEEELVHLIHNLEVDRVYFNYSDVSHEHVMHIASKVNAAGADFVLRSHRKTQLETEKPTIAITAVRTGCGKSGTTRYIAKWLKDRDQNPVVIRHPMAYRDLIKQKAERFSTYDDLIDCTIEEKEEFEPLINEGVVVYCGVDYRTIIKRATLKDHPTHFIWDGGNNDFSFLKSDLYITILDPFRWQDTDKYYPGEMNLLTADVLIINKVNSAPHESIINLENLAREKNPQAKIIYSDSVLNVSDEEVRQPLEGKFSLDEILVIEDGPTTTHGNMPFGIASLKIKRLFGDWPKMIPAIGYNEQQLKELEEKINGPDVKLVITANQIDWSRVLDIKKPVLKWTYNNRFDDDLDDLFREFNLVGA